MKYLLVVVLLLSSIFAKENFELIEDLEYYKYERNKLDIYVPKIKSNKKVIFMVHGGAWIIGNKSSKSVVKNKMKYFTDRGYIFVSTNYRLIPKVDVYEQARDLVRAFTFTQNYLKRYKIKSSNFILMGHSAGAHLVSLLSTDEKLKSKITPWLGTISIDSAVLNVEEVMGNKHKSLYDIAFGKNKKFWKKVSPFYKLQSKTKPFLLVCSKKRGDSCKEAISFKNKLNLFSTKSDVIEINLSHRQINNRLGRDLKYTRKVQEFIDTL